MKDNSPTEQTRGCEMAAAFREFDALWELPSSPERNARMEAILREVNDVAGPGQRDDAGH